jgi:hypothetical protein
MIDPSLLALATPKELAAYEKALAAEVALSSPADYAATVSNGRYQRPPHVELLSRTLTALVERRLLKPDGTPYLRLAVSMPPRHGKSELCSKYFPAWYLTRWPEGKVIVAGYEADFARDWGRKARDVLLSRARAPASPAEQGHDGRRQLGDDGRRRHADRRRGRPGDR